MTKAEIEESAYACVNHEGHCDKCEWDTKACWGGLMRWEVAKLLIEYRNGVK